ncbi:MAG TPA: hypothetical protein VEK76_11545 [Candidatus Binatia bacterium]|nr:hypothetical protein [Candidatus Binatia bacterium]
MDGATHRRRMPPDSRGGLRERLRRIEVRLGIDPGSHPEWVWLIPCATFVTTVAMFIALDLIGGTSITLTILVGLPVGVLSGAVVAGMSIAYMSASHDGDGGGGDDRRRSPDPDPKPIPPPGWWAEISPRPGPAQPEPGEEERRRDRQPVETAGASGR